MSEVHHISCVDDVAGERLEAWQRVWLFRYVLGYTVTVRGRLGAVCWSGLRTSLGAGWPPSSPRAHAGTPMQSICFCTCDPHPFLVLPRVRAVATCGALLREDSGHTFRWRSVCYREKEGEDKRKTSGGTVSARLGTTREKRCSFHSHATSRLGGLVSVGTTRPDSGRVPAQTSVKGLSTLTGCSHP